MKAKLTERGWEYDPPILFGTGNESMPQKQCEKRVLFRPESRKPAPEVFRIKKAPGKAKAKGDAL